MEIFVLTPGCVHRTQGALPTATAHLKLLKNGAVLRCGLRLLQPIYNTCPRT